MEEDELKHQSLDVVVNEYPQEQEPIHGEEKLHLKSILVLIVSLSGRQSFTRADIHLFKGDRVAQLLPDIQVSSSEIESQSTFDLADTEIIFSLLGLAAVSPIDPSVISSSCLVSL
jgi:hypothetical protein